MATIQPNVMRVLWALAELVLLHPDYDELGDVFVSSDELERMCKQRRALIVEAFASTAHGSLAHSTISDLEEDVADLLAGGKKAFHVKESAEKTAARARARELARRLVGHCFAFGTRKLSEVAPDAVKKRDAELAAKRKDAEAKRRKAEATRAAKRTAATKAKPAAAKKPLGYIDKAKPKTSKPAATVTAPKKAAAKKATPAKPKPLSSATPASLDADRTSPA